MKSPNSVLAILILALQCICLIRNIDAGKGKVPIYMPIPIPVPMPVAPHPGKGPQQQQHQGEGEVKKIYLLQPMPRFQQQSQIKGGGGFFQGPLTPPPPPQQTQGLHETRSVGRGSAYGDSGSSLLDEQRPDTYNAKSHSGRGGGHSDLKILPIIVIPPIAPMPPIQVAPHSQSTDSHKGRISFSPQFNNYLVTNGETNDQQLTSVHATSKLNDNRSFADYTGGLGETPLREISRSARQQQRHPRPMQDYGQSTWARPIKVHPDGEEHGLSLARGAERRISRDYPAPMRHLPAKALQPIPAPISGRRHFASNRRNGNRYRDQRTANSIRDVMESVYFDDEPDHDDYRQAMPSTRSEYIADGDRRRSQQSSFSEFSEPDSDSSDTGRQPIHRDGDRDSDRTVATDREPQDHMVDSIRSRRLHDLSSGNSFDSQSTNSRTYTESRPNRRRTDDLSSVYYDRDQPHDSSGLDRQKSITFTGQIDRRPHSEDDSFAAGDDEWRFDSIKSVLHVNPSLPSNATQTIDLHNSTSTVKEPSKI